MKTLKVNLGDRSYPILIGSGTIKKILSLTQKHFGSSKIVILTNRTLAKLYQSKIQKLFSKNAEVSWVIIPDGEKYKTLATVEKIYHQLCQQKTDRHSGLIALGGGVVGDIGGFVAASYLRGIPFIQIPTSLLAQVDSSVGGKTGVDLPFGKNLVGAFYQPKAVIIDLDFLKTLPQRELCCGLSEVIKYGILGDEKFFCYLEKQMDSILKLNQTALTRIIYRSCEMKAEIVAEDEKEKGKRALLNLGHTLGHAIETLTGYEKIHHGEAVSMGMVYAALLSEQQNLSPRSELPRIKNLLEKTGLPTQWPRLKPSQYAKVMANDKKAVGKMIQYVSIRKIGEAELIKLSPKEIAQYINH